MNTLDLSNKVALVTGAASGIGAACVRRLASLGATVIAVDVDDSAGDALVQSLAGKHRYYHLDVTDSGQWRTLLKQVREQFGQLDILHLNAGVMSRPKGAPLLDDPLAWVTEHAYHKVGSVNLDGVVYGILAALELGGCERIILTASGAAVTPLAMDVYYTATKFAQLGLALALAPSLAARGMRIDVICPGAVDTPITAPDIRASAFKQESPDFIASALVQVLASPQADNNAWLAYNEKDGVLPYTPFGAKGALDLLERA